MTTASVPLPGLSYCRVLLEVTPVPPWRILPVRRFVHACLAARRGGPVCADVSGLVCEFAGYTPDAFEPALRVDATGRAAPRLWFTGLSAPDATGYRPADGVRTVRALLPGFGHLVADDFDPRPADGVYRFRLCLDAPRVCLTPGGANFADVTGAPDTTGLTDHGHTHFLTDIDARVGGVHRRTAAVPDPLFRLIPASQVRTRRRDGRHWLPIAAGIGSAETDAEVLLFATRAPTPPGPPPDAAADTDFEAMRETDFAVLDRFDDEPLPKRRRLA